MISKEIGTSENPSGSNNVKYNTWYYGKEVSGSSYPWCMAFVQWCFNQAGLTLPYRTAACQTLLDWYNQNDPSRVHTSNPKPGDIVIFGKPGQRAGHTGIVTGSDQTYVYTIEGNTTTTHTDFSANGGCVSDKKHKWDCGRLKAFITAVDFDAIQKTNISSNSTSFTGSDDSIEDLWMYFKKLGYSDKATAAILGAWMSESSNNPKRIEGDYLGYFKEYGGYDMVNNQDQLDAYTKRLFQQYDNDGLSIAKSRYEANGHYYPGIGMAQWTGPRGKALLDFARNNNKDWSSRATQLEYLSTELNGAYKSTKNAIENAADVNEATRVFTKGFEGSSRGIEGRQAHARSLYNQFAGKYNTASSMGGTIYNTDGSADEMVLKDPLTGQILERQSPIVDTDEMYRTGGPELETSSFRPATFIPKIRSNQNLDMGGPSTSDYTGMPTTVTSNAPNTNSITRTAPIVNTTPEASIVQQTDLTAMTALVTRMVEELIKITNNTASSSDLLGSLNEKEFVDQGLRDSLNALGNAKKAQRSNTLPKVNATMASSMAKP